MTPQTKLFIKKITDKVIIIEGGALIKAGFSFALSKLCSIAKLVHNTNNFARTKGTFINLIPNSKMSLFKAQIKGDLEHKERWRLNKAVKEYTV